WTLRIFEQMLDTRQRFSEPDAISLRSFHLAPLSSTAARVARHFQRTRPRASRLMMEGLMVVPTTRYIRRRELVNLLGGMTVAWPFATRAQQAERVQRIGMLMSFPASDPEAPIRVTAFQQRLQELGWTDRHNIQIDYHRADNDSA